MPRALVLILAMSAWGAPHAVHSSEPGLPPRGVAPPTRIPPILEPPAAPAAEPVDSSVLPRVVRRAVVKDAAQRFMVTESAVVLTRAEQVTWSDGSLGCHQPGGIYTQMIVPGFRVVAKTEDRELVYHTDSRGHVIACANSSRTGPAPGAQPDR